MSQGFDFEHLVELCRQTHEETRQSATRAVDHSLVVRNWLFGWYIVEFENGGADRSELYGKELIARLSNKLKASGLKGCSPTNLRKFREFYQGYPEIQQTLSVNSVLAPTGIAATVFSAIGKRFSLGWSHYVTLLTIDNPDARRFYEIEAAESDWSVRELERQIASSLYERLALSRDKEEVRRLAHEGQVTMHAPFILVGGIVKMYGIKDEGHFKKMELSQS